MATNHAPPFDLAWRGPFTDAELNALHASAFASSLEARAWRAQVERWSLGWVTARSPTGDRLVGFVNVAWDGGRHAFLLDTAVAPPAQRQGLARQMVAMAQREAATAGCEWLHVDFADRLAPFYRDACGFAATAAGLVRLTAA